MRADRARRAIAEAPLRHRLRATVSIGLCDLEAATLGRRGAAARRRRPVLGQGARARPVLALRPDGGARARRAPAHPRARSHPGARRPARAGAGHRRQGPGDPGALRARRGAQRAPGDRRGAGRPTASRCCATPRCCTTSARSASPTRSCSRTGRSTTTSSPIVREHAVLGARIVGDVLDEEQIAWIAGHHERPDGSGYPAALEGDAMPEGAALLALADAWDVMVSDRSYSAPMTVEAALAEARARAGRAVRRPPPSRRSRRWRRAATSCPWRRGCTSRPSEPSRRGQRAVGVRAARGQEREERQPVAALVEVEVGHEHGGLVARRLHELAPVGVGDERGAVEASAAPRSRSG